MTGGALADPEVWRQGIEAMADEPSIGLIGVVTSLPTAGEPQRDNTFDAVGSTLTKTGVPGVIFPQIEQVQSEYVREVNAASGLRNVLPSVERFVLAAAGLSRWSNWLIDRRSAPVAAPDGITLDGSGPGIGLAARVRELEDADAGPTVPVEPRQPVGERGVKGCRRRRPVERVDVVLKVVAAPWPAMPSGVAGPGYLGAGRRRWRRSGTRHRMPW